MASPTQTVAGKSKANLLIAEDLLKILRDLSHCPYQSPLPIHVHGMVGPHQTVIIFPVK